MLSGIPQELLDPCRAKELVGRAPHGEYNRLETPEELALLCSIYADLCLYVNFFQPVLKVIGKEQDDGKTVKKYDQATTPYHWVLALEQLPIKTKARLTNLYVSLNPVALGAIIDTKVTRLWKIVR